MASHICTKTLQWSDNRFFLLYSKPAVQVSRWPLNLNLILLRRRSGTGHLRRCCEHIWWSPRTDVAWVLRACVATWSTKMKRSLHFSCSALDLTCVGRALTPFFAPNQSFKYSWCAEFSIQDQVFWWFSKLKKKIPVNLFMNVYNITVWISIFFNWKHFLRIYFLYEELSTPCSFVYNV